MNDIRHRYINCSMRLTHQRRRTLQDATEAMVNILQAWISPTPVAPENSLCLECFGMLRQVSLDGAAQPPMFGHRSVCFACGISNLRSRTHLVHSDCAERHVIIRQTLPHLVPHLTRVARLLEEMFNGKLSKMSTCCPYVYSSKISSKNVAGANISLYLPQPRYHVTAIT